MEGKKSDRGNNGETTKVVLNIAINTVSRDCVVSSLTVNGGNPRIDQTIKEGKEPHSNWHDIQV